MNRFFTAGPLKAGESACIDDEKDVHHAARVLRLKAGETVELCDGIGTEAVARIEAVEKHRIGLTVLETVEIRRESPLEITLFQALPKGQKMDLLLQKGTEAGMAAFVPVQSERCVVKLSGDSDARKKVERWTEIVEEAAKQSKRGRIPVVHMPIRMQEAEAACAGFDLVLVPHTGEGTVPLNAALNRSGIPKRIAVWIGPEGGFTEEEAQGLQRCGGICVTLGPRILRTETAGLVLASALQFHWGDLGGITE